MRVNTTESSFYTDSELKINLLLISVFTLTFFVLYVTITRNKKTARELAFALGVRSVQLPCIRVIFL